MFGNTTSAATSTVFNFIPGTTYTPGTWDSPYAAWAFAIDITALFGAECGTFAVAMSLRNGNGVWSNTNSFVVPG